MAQSSLWINLLNVLKLPVHLEYCRFSGHGVDVHPINFAAKQFGLLDACSVCLAKQVAVCLTLMCELMLSVGTVGCLSLIHI